jgi:hypothetical protein
LPTSYLHDEIVTLRRAILAAWSARVHPDTRVTRELAVRWDPEHPTYGVDPDGAVSVRARPDPESLQHTAPVFAIEVVNQTEARKDYSIAPDTYAACGAPMAALSVSRSGDVT